MAPSYAGYDISTLGYHPFLDAVQQSGEMIGTPTAARTALPNTFSSATSDNGKLFVTGYSEGGHVAMATQCALEAAGKTVTAAAPMSRPYALEAFGDAIFFGDVDIGSTVFGPLLTTSYQHAYGNIYMSPPTSIAPPMRRVSKPCCPVRRQLIPCLPTVRCRRPRCSTAPCPS